LWLVCKSNPSEKYPGDFWRLAKGWIDDSDDGNKPGPISRGEKKATEEDLVTTATREVKEEGGVEAKIVKKIGSFRYFIGRKLKFVTFYLMEFIRDLPEGFGFETERIEWLPIDEAVGRVDLKIEKDILKKAGEVLGSGIQNSLI
jgi:8-oxo-dGTP pyrophosphatase MutT (NUDIX family)